MATAVFDVSGFLHKFTRKNPKLVGGIPISGLEILLKKLIRDHSGEVAYLILDPLSSGDYNNHESNESEYKGTRNPKTYEIRKLEEFIVQFADDMNVNVIVAERPFESDDYIYSVVSEIIMSRPKETIVVYGDDIDLTACVINENVTYRAINSITPDVDLSNYELFASRRNTACFHNMIAGYLVAYGKQSDNVSPMSNSIDVWNEMIRTYKELENRSAITRSRLSRVSELSNFKWFVDNMVYVDDETRAEILQRSESICCERVPITLPERRIPNTEVIYGILGGIGSNLYPRTGMRNVETMDRVSQFFGISNVRREDSDARVDLSNLDVNDDLLETTLDLSDFVRNLEDGMFEK